METPIMNAAEAKSRCTSLKNEVNERMLNKMSRLIGEAVTKGMPNISVSTLEMNDVIKQHLESLGYVVTKHNGDPCSGGSSFIVKWM